MRYNVLNEAGELVAVIVASSLEDAVRKAHQLYTGCRVELSNQQEKEVEPHGRDK